MKRFVLGAVVSASLILSGHLAYAGSPSLAGSASAIPGWPARGPMLEMTCPGINACFAVGSLPVPARATPNPAGGVLARTDNGGATWTLRSDPHTVFGGISCPSPSQCYVGSAHMTVHMVDAHHGVTRVKSGISVTTDAGKTWQEHPLPAPAGRNEALACPTVTRCVLWREATSPTVPKAEVLVTTDAAKTWKVSRIVTQGRPTGAVLACPTTRTCFLYGGYSGTSVSKSQDGGKTWRVLPRSDMVALSGVPPRALASMGGLACPSAQVCYTAQGHARCQCDAWGPYGTIFGTRDGGNHWSLLYKAHGRDYPEGNVTCPGTSVCYVVGSAQRDVLADQIVLATKDGGRTWTTHRLPVTGLSCASTDVCYAFSTAAVVFRTVDGGTTWQPLP